MSNHKRRDGYWKYYHLAHTQERSFLVDNIVSLVSENLPPASQKKKKNKTRVGRKQIHSRAKMYCICIIMVALGLTYRDTQNIIPSLNLPWNDNEPVPDHTTIAKFFGRIPVNWLENILARTAYLCLAECGWQKGLLGADSTAVETGTYMHEMRPLKNRQHGFEHIRIRQHLKWHITAVLDNLVILSSRITTKKTHDSPVLKTMLDRMKKLGIDLRGSIFDADKGYDSDDRCRQIFWMGMLPNISQRIDAINRNRRFRRLASRLFDVSVYRYRGLIEGIFGAEESEHHQLYCRFHKRANQHRWGQIKSIGWNLEVLNRLYCANILRIEVKRYVDVN